MSKFKVGDRVKRIGCPNSRMKPGDIGEITSIRQDKRNGDWLMIRLDKTGDIDGSHNENYFDLVTTTFINHIITDIKDQDQANRIGKKLDSMGCSLGYDIKWSKYTRSIIKVNENSIYYTYWDNDEPYWTHITANEFLGEEPSETVLTSYSDTATTIPSKWCGAGISNKLIEQLEQDELYVTISKEFNKYNTPTTPSSVKGKNIMSNIVNFAKDLLLSPNEKLLRKYGLHDENSNNTSEARQLINDKIYNSPENQAYLLEVATAKQAEDKSNK